MANYALNGCRTCVDGILFNLIEVIQPMFDVPIWWHFVVGGFAFGLVFMATDPVSAAYTEKGKIYYGLLIGVMTTY